MPAPAPASAASRRADNPALLEGLLAEPVEPNRLQGSGSSPSSRAERRLRPCVCLERVHCLAPWSSGRVC